MLLRAVVGFAVSVCLGGCTEDGREVQADDAVAHFRANQPAYEKIVELVAACRPVTKEGMQATLWSRGSPEAERCAVPDHSQDELLAALRAADAVSVSYFAPDSRSGTNGDIERVRITIFSGGLGVSGSMTSFVYSFRPLATPPADEGDVRSGVDRKAVTGPPYHWWWERSY